MALRVLSLFSGIGAFEQALTNLHIEYETVNYCEIDKYAAKSYSILHGVPEELNLGDITKVDTTKLPQHIDLLTHGSPCQSFSIGGRGEGGDIGTNTKSSLMWYSVEIIKALKPKCVIWENVKNVLSVRHKHNFELYCEVLESFGYTNTYKVLNSKDYGIPQNRERIYCISLLGNQPDFSFPDPIGCNTRLCDLLADRVPEKYYLRTPKALNFIKQLDMDKLPTTPMENKLYSLGHMEGAHEMSNRVYHPSGISPTILASERQVCTGGMNPPKILEHTIKIEYLGSLSTKDRVGDGKPLSRNSPSGDRVYSSHGLACTQAAIGGGNGGSTGLYVHNYAIRKLSPLETWCLMGFSKEAFNLVQAIPTSDTQLYKQAGNSITVPVLEHIYKQIPSIMAHQKDLVETDN